MASNWTKKNIFRVVILGIIGIICFPINLLILTGILETTFYPVIFIIGLLIGTLGVSFVLASIAVLQYYGRAPEDKWSIHTTCLVDVHVYALVRHPQYLGIILSVFVTTLLWYPHWLFGLLGMVGTIIIYTYARDEEHNLIQQFGEDYIRYMHRVPRMNLLVGLVRLIKRTRAQGGLLIGRRGTPGIQRPAQRGSGRIYKKGI
jgi:protein-S-isoprenylcysteine O-methyltransferase Ste14